MRGLFKRARSLAESDPANAIPSRETILPLHADVSYPSHVGHARETRAGRERTIENRVIGGGEMSRDILPRQARADQILRFIYRGCGRRSRPLCHSSLPFLRSVRAVYDNSGPPFHLCYWSVVYLLEFAVRSSIALERKISLSLARSYDRSRYDLHSPWLSKLDKFEQQGM